MVDWGLGPQMENGEYLHSVVCSGSRRYPRRPGNTCCCHSSDLWFRRLRVERHGADAKRTLWIATCHSCDKRWEFPYSGEPIPREVLCLACLLWAKVEEVSWDGLDFANLLPVFERAR